MEILPIFRTLACSAAPLALTGTTSETALVTIAVPAGVMGPNGLIRVTATFSCTNSANSKIGRVRFSGTAYTAITMTNLAILRTSFFIHNRNSESSQVGFASNSTSGVGTSTSSLATSTIDTSQASEVVFSGALTSGAETITLESYVVDVKYGA